MASRVNGWLSGATPTSLATRRHHDEPMARIGIVFLWLCYAIVGAAAPPRAIFADDPGAGGKPNLLQAGPASEGDEERLREASAHYAALRAELERQVRAVQLSQACVSLQRMIELQSAACGDDHWLTRPLKVSKAELEVVRAGDVVFHPAYARAEIARSEGMQLYGAGKYRSASRLLGEALLLQSRLLGEESFHYAVTADGYALIQLGIARATKSETALKTAEEMFERAARTYERFFTRRDPAYAGAIDSLGMVAFERGELDSAEARITKAMRLRKELLGPHCRDFVMSLKHLTMLEVEKRKYADAANAIEEALEICDAAGSSAEPMRNACLATKARLLAAKGDYAESASLYASAIAFIEGSMSHEHPDLVVVLTEYASVLRSLGRIEDASSCDARASAIQTGLADEQSGQ